MCLNEHPTDISQQPEIMNGFLLLHQTDQVLGAVIGVAPVEHFLAGRQGQLQQRWGTLTSCQGLFVGLQ